MALRHPALASVNATELMFITTLSPDQGKYLYDQFAHPDQAEERLLFVIDYRAGRRDHQGLASLGYDGEDASWYLTFNYDLVRGQFPDAISLEELFGVLQGSPMEVTADCSVQFRYPATWKSVIQLPLKLVETDLLPWSEIRGIRAVKRSGDEVVFSVVMDRPNNRAFFFSVSFGLSGTLNADFPFLMLEKATEISKGFMVPTRGRRRREA